MKRLLALLALCATSLAASSAFAQAAATAPAGATGLCKDGSYSSNDTKKGACAGHKGVKEWFAPVASTDSAKPAAAGVPVAPAPRPTAAATATAVAAAPAPKLAAAPVPPVAPAPHVAAAPMPAVAPAAGGGPGQVWVNSGTKVYHCAGTKFYGKTKQGEYMSEAAARTAGNHADHGKACSS